MCRRRDNASSELGNEWVLRVEVVGAIVVEVELTEAGLGQVLGLVSEELARDVRVSGESEDPQVGFQFDPPLAESEIAELVEVIVDLGWEQPGVTGREFPQAPLGLALASNPGGEVVVDLR